MLAPHAREESRHLLVDCVVDPDGDPRAAAGGHQLGRLVDRPVPRDGLAPRVAAHDRRRAARAPAGRVDRRTAVAQRQRGAAPDAPARAGDDRDRAPQIGRTPPAGHNWPPLFDISNIIVHVGLGHRALRAQRWSREMGTLRPLFRCAGTYVLLTRWEVGVRGQPDTPENRLALLRRLDRPDGVLHVHERDESPLIAGMVRDGLPVPVLFTKTATDYAVGEQGRALLAERRVGQPAPRTPPHWPRLVGPDRGARGPGVLGRARFSGTGGRRTARTTRGCARTSGAHGANGGRPPSRRRGAARPRRHCRTERARAAHAAGAAEQRRGGERRALPDADRRLRVPTGPRRSSRSRSGPPCMRPLRRRAGARERPFAAGDRNRYAGYRAWTAPAGVTACGTSSPAPRRRRGCTGAAGQGCGTSCSAASRASSAAS